MANEILVTSPKSRALGFDFACLWQCIVYGLGLVFGLGLVNSEFIGLSLSTLSLVSSVVKMQSSNNKRLHVF